MPLLLSWPMYAIAPAAVATFWTALRVALATEGFGDLPACLATPDDLESHWRDPRLVLSQTCGFPFVTSLAGAVRYVATPRFDVPGCGGGFYRSAVVVRDDEPASGIAEMAGRRAAFNSRDSQSGYNALQALVAPHAVGGRFFSAVVETGAHRRSLQAVASGGADLAAIDGVTLALIQDHVPAEFHGLRVLCHTARAPGLPVITAARTSDADLARLRRAIATACRPDTPAGRSLRLDGIEILPTAAYDVIKTMRADAVGRGYPDLA